MKCGGGAIWEGFQTTSKSTCWNIACEGGYMSLHVATIVNTLAGVEYGMAGLRIWHSMSI